MALDLLRLVEIGWYLKDHRNLVTYRLHRRLGNRPYKKCLGLVGQLSRRLGHYSRIGHFYLLQCIYNKLLCRQVRH